MNPGVVAFVVVLLGALVVYGVVVLADSGDDETTTGGTTGATTATTSATPFEVGSSELPQPLVGRWQGTAHQESTSSTYDVDITLYRDGTEDRVGDVSYPSLDCGGYYTLADVAEESVVLTEHITDGDECVDGIDISLSFVDEGEIRYTFEYQGDPEDGTGTLVRTD